jgi:iron complex outermembrane receptor protein
MKHLKQYIILPLLLLLTFCNHLAFAGKADKTSLSGKIIDKTTKEPLIGATIYIPDLKTGTATNINGEYVLNNLPNHKFLVQVKYVGYATYSEVIDLATITNRNFELNASAIEGKEVVITGSAVSTDNDRSSVSLIVVDKAKLFSEPSTNIIDAIAHLPGVSQITTGGNISKPVIRGLGYNHIVTLNEGVRQEGQQWGDEHGIEIDDNSADKIEILRGPSSLLYGSDAMGGVINFLEPLPAAQNTMGGEVSLKYGTNEGLTDNSLMLEGNKNGFSGRIRATYKSAGSFSNPLERVYNSGYNEQNLNGMLGINKSWGYSHLHFSHYNSNIGIVEGGRDSASGKFVDANGVIVPESRLNTRKLALPNQNIQHDKVTLVNRFIIGNSQLAVNVGYQTNSRKEFSVSQEEPGLFFYLKTYSYDAKFYFPEVKHWETVIGISGMNQNNENKGSKFLIPDYTLNDIGGFAYAKKSWDKATLNFGIRFDERKVEGKQLVNNGDTLFTHFNSSFLAASGAVGFTYRLSKLINLKANVGRGFRAPNIPELSANGKHEGTFRYEIGNPDLKPETSLQIDGSATAETNRISVELGIYRNLIDNFIYYRNFNGEVRFVDGANVPVYRYVQGAALLQGFEFSADVHILSNLHFENNVSYVYAKNMDTDKPLPFTPPLSVHDELRYIFKKNNKVFSNPYLRFGVDNHFGQSRIDDFETSTVGYSLMNAGIGTGIKIGRQQALFNIGINNIANTTYYDHLSRLKYVGIYNKGRSVTFSLLIPFGGKN